MTVAETENDFLRNRVIFFVFISVIAIYLTAV